MKNPWLKKNPLLSMWLSGANRVAGIARAHVTAETKRQVRAAMKEGIKQASDFWSGALTRPASKKKRRR